MKLEIDPIEEVQLPPRDVNRMADLIGQERLDDLLATGVRLVDMLGDRAMLHVNSTAAGGGVAEMLLVLLPYAREAGINARWLVIKGDPKFFAITKRIHNHLYGTEGDGGPLGPQEREHYEAVSHANVGQIQDVARSGDVFVLHDPQTCGLAESLKHQGYKIVWRCHVGIDEQNENSNKGWEFLRPYLEPYVDHYVFTKREFAPDWVPQERLHQIPPSIDPFSPKNRDLSEDDVLDILDWIGVIDADRARVPVPFNRADGTVGRVERYADIIRSGPAPGADSPLVIQISRWDKMKDMPGVMHGFADWVTHEHDAQLALVGPNVANVADDPEGAEILEQCWKEWQQLPDGLRSRISLITLPMADGDENALMVNALQRHATIIVQKSIAEGFGLTVTEAMLKNRPIIATAVGGIADQLENGVSAELIQDPEDLSEFVEALSKIVDDPAYAEELGDAAYHEAIENWVGDKHLHRWANLFELMLNED